MTRKEAALILGVRESSTPKRIKEAHRKLLILNHPDTGGSTYMAGKINEAKELLLKGKKMWCGVVWRIFFPKYWIFKENFYLSNNIIGNIADNLNRTNHMKK